jgi:NADP-dependent 3-hydroxy acid dehydrogenase YdfG
MEPVGASVVADFGKLDVLINNAGLMPIRPMSEVKTDEWDAMIDVSLKGTLYGIAAAPPRFIAQVGNREGNRATSNQSGVLKTGGAQSRSVFRAAPR